MTSPSVPVGQPRKGDYPTDLANVLADAMTIWDEAEGLDPGAVPEDPSLAEAIENNWGLVEFLALYISRLPVADRMKVMGMEPKGWVGTLGTVVPRIAASVEASGQFRRLYVEATDA